MATATSLTAGGSRNAYDTVAASQTDSSLVAAAAGKRIRVLALGISCGGTASTVVFNTKGAGAGTACGPIFQNSISLPLTDDGWFQTAVGEGLTVSTGAGSSTGILIKWEYAR